MTKLLRTIRLDPSDTVAFEQAAEPGEWAVPGSFQFWDEDVSALKGKRRVAFRSGFMGLTSFGCSTLVVVVHITPEERLEAVQSLAAHLMQAHGAPNMGAALAAADEEISFAQSCAEHAEQTLIIMHRTLDTDGAIREQFRTIKPGLPFNKDTHSRVFSFVEVEGEDEPEERVDLVNLVESTRI